MDEMCIYRIQVHGPVDEAALNVMSPVQVRVEMGETAVTHLAARTDQTGLIGLLRHLHTLGFVLLALNRTELSGADS